MFTVYEHLVFLKLDTRTLLPKLQHFFVSFFCLFVCFCPCCSWLGSITESKILESDDKDEHSLRIVPLAVKFAVPQKAGVPERVSARRAAHTLLVPEAVGDSEQESVCDRPAASGAHWPLIHICRDGKGWSGHTSSCSGAQRGNIISPVRKCV